jgi:hypothetical protein
MSVILNLMIRTLLRLGLAASSLIWTVTPSLLAAQSKEPPNNPKRFVFLLPDHFRGWVCVDFGVVGAAPLLRERDALVVKPRQGEVLVTSDKTDALFLVGDAWYEVSGKRRSLPSDVNVQAGPSRTGKTESTERRCAFVGTIDERDASGEAPGFENRPGKESAIPPDERQALEVLYKTTEGDRWKHRVGWLGAPGSECNWHGVICGSSDDGSMRIMDLDLYENDLAGAIPKEIGNLRKLKFLNLGMNYLTGAIPSTLGELGDLESLTLFGNHLSGLVPDPLIQRWMAGPLDISAETHLLTDVSEIDFESDSSAVLCARHRIILRLDNSVISYTERCRRATPNDRATFCEVKEGRTDGREFATLGWLVERNRFFGLNAEYYRSVTHATFENTRVTKNGKVHAVSNYAGAGPFQLWAIQRAIEGVAASAEWDKTSTQQKCPR